MMSRNLIQCRSEDVKKPKKFAYGVLHRHPTLTFFFEGGTSTWTSKQGGGDKKIFEDYLKQQKKSISIRFALQVMKSVQFRRRPIVVLPPIEYTCVCVCAFLSTRSAKIWQLNKFISVLRHTETKDLEKCGSVFLSDSTLHIRTCRACC